MSVAALVLGILGIVLALVPSFGITQMIGVVLGIVALVLGIIGRKQAVDEGRPTGLATAGLVLGIVSMVFAALLFAACKYCEHKVTTGLEKGMKNGDFQRQFRKGLEEGLRRQQQELDRRRREQGGGGTNEP